MEIGLILICLISVGLKVLLNCSLNKHKTTLYICSTIRFIVMFYFVACLGQIRVVTNHPSDIATPFYGLINYANSLNCRWQLEAPVGQVNIQLFLARTKAKKYNIQTDQKLKAIFKFCASTKMGLSNNFE